MSLVMTERFHASLTGAVSPERTAETLQERLKDILEQAEAL